MNTPARTKQALSSNNTEDPTHGSTVNSTQFTEHYPAETFSQFAFLQGLTSLPLIQGIYLF